MQLEFLIHLHEKDLALLENIQRFFGGVGAIHMGQKNSCTYYVSARKDLLVILAQTSLFGEKRGSDKYPLITEKLRDYLLFRRAFSITSQGPLDSYNLQQIVNIRSVLNKGLTPVLKEAFPLTIPVDKPKLEIREIPHGD